MAQARLLITSHRLLHVWRIVFLAAASLLLASAVSAQDFPSRSIKIVNPYTAGGPVDGMIRIMAEEAGRKFGQTVFIENRPGASTLIGTRDVSSSPPNGYSLLVQTSALMVNTFITANPGYKISDFVTIAPVGGLSSTLAVPSDFQAANLKDFIAYVKANPGKYNFGTLGGGGAINLLSDRFLSRTRLSMVAVQYRGGADGLNALIARDISMHILGIQIAFPHVQAGTLKALATISENRNPLLPDVPTFREEGMTDMSITPWTVLFARSGTPDDILQKLRTVFAEVALSKEYRQKIEKIGGDSWTPLGKELDELIALDTQLWQKDIERMGLGAK